MLCHRTLKSNNSEGIALLSPQPTIQDLPKNININSNNILVAGCEGCLYRFIWLRRLISELAMHYTDKVCWTLLVFFWRILCASLVFVFTVCVLL